MPDTPEDLPLDSERLLQDCVAQALEHEDPERFVAWFRASLSRYMDDPQGDLFQDPVGHDRFAILMARSIWNAIPLPGNGLRPRPLPEPRRNDRCFCGSGQKYKRCCARAAAPPVLDSDAVLPVVLERVSPERLEREIAAGRAPMESIVTLAATYADASKPWKAARTLEPLFAGPARKPDERLEYALDLLCDQYNELGHHRKKRALLDRIIQTTPRSPLRSGAWQRLATVRIDDGDPAGAWDAFEAARQDSPDSPGLGLLEVQLLVAENRIEEAGERAKFWERRLRRLGFDDDRTLAFFSEMAQAPHATMATVGLAAADGAGERLAAWLNDVQDRPLPAHSAVDPDEAPEEEDATAALTNRLRAMGVASHEIDNALAMLNEQREDGDQTSAAPIEHESSGTEPPDLPEPPDSLCLVPPPDVAGTERLWREVCPVDKPFSVQPDPFDDADPWEPDEENQWMSFLEDHPEAFDSLDILDDLATAVRRHPQFGANWVDTALLAPLLQRAEAIARHAVRDQTEPRIAWQLAENRPALRALARLINLYLDRGQEHEADRTMAWLLAVNPSDNHGFRTLLANQRLRQDDDEGVLALSDAYPGDPHPECAYGRVLALYRLGRLDAAEQALYEAMQRLPKVVRAVTAKRVRQPRIDPGLITLGGDDQAWIYREEMRDVWRDTPGALDWLKHTAKRAR